MQYICIYMFLLLVALYYPRIVTLINDFQKEVIDIADIDDIAKSCYTEIPNAIKELEATDMESVVNFSDMESCKKVDALCPVLSSALKGAMGGKDRKPDGESASDHATRTLCYGAIFKARLVFNM